MEGLEVVERRRRSAAVHCSSRRSRRVAEVGSQKSCGPRNRGFPPSGLYACRCCCIPYDMVCALAWLCFSFSFSLSLSDIMSPNLSASLDIKIHVCRVVWKSSEDDLGVEQLSETGGLGGSFTKKEKEVGNVDVQQQANNQRRGSVPTCLIYHRPFVPSQGKSSPSYRTGRRDSMHNICIHHRLRLRSAIYHDSCGADVVRTSDSFLPKDLLTDGSDPHALQRKEPQRHRAIGLVPVSAPAVLRCPAAGEWYGRRGPPHDSTACQLTAGVCTEYSNEHVGELGISISDKSR